MAQTGLRHAAVAAPTKKADGAKERTKKGLEFWCPLCFNFRRDRLFERHLKPGICPALRKDMAEEEWKGLVVKARTELRSGLDSVAPNMYFNPNNIPDRVYSKADVCHILERWGHQSIPEKYRETVVARIDDPKKAAHVTFCFKDAADASERRGPEPPAVRPLGQLHFSASM